MKESVKERYLEFFAEWLRESTDFDVAKVVKVEQVTKSDGYCESCWSEWEEVNIHYVTSEGEPKVYEYYGSLADFFDVE